MVPGLVERLAHVEPPRFSQSSLCPNSCLKPSGASSWLRTLCSYVIARDIVIGYWAWMLSMGRLSGPLPKRSECFWRTARHPGHLGGGWHTHPVAGRAGLAAHWRRIWLPRAIVLTALGPNLTPVRPPREGVKGTASASTRKRKDTPISQQSNGGSLQKAPR